MVYEKSKRGFVDVLGFSKWSSMVFNISCAQEKYYRNKMSPHIADKLEEILLMYPESFKY